ncbi:attacin-like [Battus philenor]|uniref:attacin-like n=1 Tax=Battus philenor TaxID=42288 RepID=UPI0035CEE0F4
MFRSSTIILGLLFVCVQSRHLYNDDVRGPYLLIEDGPYVDVYELEDVQSDEPQQLHGENLMRVRRQAHGVLSSNPDGSSNFAAKFQLAGDDKNKLSAIGTIAGASGDGSFKAGGGGLAWDNVKGHGASLTGQHIPGFGDQLTAAGKANLFHNDHHDLTADAFATRNFPSNPNIPNFDTYGGKVGYTFDNKVGASLGMAHTDLFKKTDYSAMGNLNLFKTPSSSLDFSAGMSKSVSPYMPSRGWEPSGGLSFTKWF